MVNFDVSVSFWDAYLVTVYATVSLWYETCANVTTNILLEQTLSALYILKGLIKYSVLKC